MADPYSATTPDTPIPTPAPIDLSTLTELQLEAAAYRHIKAIATLRQELGMIEKVLAKRRT